MKRSLQTEGQKQAKRRLSYIKSDNCGKVAAKPSYWTTEFLDLYLEHCDELAFHDPKAGCLLSAHAPILAERIRIGTEDGQFRSDRARLSARVIAIAVRASCCRAAGDLQEAQAHIAQAETLARGREISARAYCELLRRKAAVKVSMGASDAEDCLNRAIKMAETTKDEPNLSDGLVCRGVLTGNIEDLARGLALADYRTKRGGRTATAACINIVLGSRSGNLAGTLKFLWAAKKSLARKETSIMKLRVQWLYSYFEAKLGSTKSGLRGLRKARPALLEMEAYSDYLICSLDLIERLRLCVEVDHEEIGSVVDEMLAVYQEHFEESKAEFALMLHNFLQSNVIEEEKLKSALVVALQAHCER